MPLSGLIAEVIDRWLVLVGGNGPYRGSGVRDEVAESRLNHAKEQVNGTYNLYTYWQVRKDALRPWHERLERLRSSPH